MSILQELEGRGLVQDVTNRDALGELLAQGPVSFYAGYDPTAHSLHAGNLIPVILQARLQRAGHRPIVLVGGATGMIGDPTGKSDERTLLDQDTLQENLEAIRHQLSQFLTFGDGPTDAVMVNNFDWFQRIGYLEFLRDVGKLMTINYMVAKESVRARLSDREQGISYTEFSYMLLQGYDFVHLAQSHNCRLQVGGSDQWGNITTGIELQRKLGRPGVYGVVAPLLLDSNGNKMGKTSTGNRVWLNSELTSPYAFYQYWLNVRDAEVPGLLKIFSWRSLPELTDTIAAHEAAPHQRTAQRMLAEDITTWVHGETACRGAMAASQVMFGGSLADMTDDDLRPLLQDLPSTKMPRSELSSGIELVDMLQRTGLAASKAAARRLIKQGGVYVNNVRVGDSSEVLTTEQLGTEHMMILRCGKKKYHIVCVD